MATKVKPSRLQVSWTPQAWCVPVYVDENCFCWWAWWGWGGGCSEWWCITGTLCDQTDLQWALDCKLNTSALSNAAYWSGWDGDCTHAATKDAIYDKIRTVDTSLAGKANDISVVKLTCNQVIDWIKTFCISPVVPDKCAAAVNCGTAIATEAQVYNVAQAIPTDNCQLANWCWYTTCTGTLVAWDLACYACCCDIPTDNCQLSNWCGYTTCTWTLQSCDIACINGCCLTSGGNICIQSWDVWISSQCCNILTSGTKLWAWCQCDYEWLWTYDNNTIYLTL